MVFGMVYCCKLYHCFFQGVNLLRERKGKMAFLLLQVILLLSLGC